MHAFHGQVAGQLDCGSQVSPGSTAEFPHRPVQSSSLVALQAGGQQPSPLAHVVCRLAFTHSAVHAAAVPCKVRSWQPSAGQLAGQLTPSHLSLHAGSVTPFPHWQLQSSSLPIVHPGGQHPSPLPQVVIDVLLTHSAVQAAALPCNVRCWQPTGGQLVGQLTPSHFSPTSVTPFPQLGVQSPSLVALQVPGQHPSPLTQAVWTPSLMHWARQEPGLATRRSVHPCCGHDVGQSATGSQTSPHDVSIMLLPHVQLQSLSVDPQPVGQHPSPATQVVCSPLSTQAAVQVVADPRSSKVSQPTWGQLVGQLATGSQVSPGSRRPLPQLTGTAPSNGLSTPASRMASSICWTAPSGNILAQPLSRQQTLTPLAAPGICSQV
jgi:hypothetical protein